MAKFKSGNVLFKKIYSAASAIDIGELSKAIAADAGPMIPLGKLQKAVTEVKAAKATKPVVHLGIVSNGDLELHVQGPDNYSLEALVVKNYAKLKSDRAKAVVINMDKGDKTIDSSSLTMAKAKGTTAVEAKDAKLTEVTGDIVILAHGTPTGGSPGKVYAKLFADKKPAEIVTYLVKTKKLPLTFAGVVYLDGCFTAAGPSQGKSAKELNNFSKKVYDGLKKAGYTKLQVKGNLGLAATLEGGKESVTDAQMEAEVKKATKGIQKKVDAAKKKKADISAKLTPYLVDLKKYQQAEAKLKGSGHGLPEDKLPAAKANIAKKIEEVKAKIKPLNDAGIKADKEWDALYNEKKKILEGLKKKGISEDKIEDLVGTFGPETL